MSGNRQVIDELRDLLWSIEEGSISGDGIARIDELVCKDETLLRQYVEYTRLVSDLKFGTTDDRIHTDLSRVFGLEEENSACAVDASDEYDYYGADDVCLAAESPHQPFTSFPALPSLSTNHHPLPSNFVGGPVFSYMVATVVLCAMLLGAWAYKVSSVDHFPIDTADAPKTNGRPAPFFVGQITGMKDCVWADNETSTIIGASIPLGRKYSLSSGLLEITYTSGARVILEGPCNYTVNSRIGGHLQRGKLVARVEVRGERRVERGKKRVASGQWLVARKEGRETRGGLAASAASAEPQVENPLPPAPSPQPLFSVTTPTAVVTDLGTEFGVEVKTGGETQVHVFQGTVEAELYGSSGATGRKVKLTTGQAAGFDSRQASIVSIPSRPQEFTRVIPMAVGPLRNVALKKTIIKWSGVYRYGDPTKGTSDWTTWDRFGVWHVNDGITDESEQGNAYWKGRERTLDEYFVIYLAGKYDIQRIELVNTHNSIGNDRGTKDFEIWAADEIDQYKELVSPRLVLKGTLPCRFGAGADIPCDVFSAEAGDFERFNACYVKFVAKTFYEGKNFGGCGLNEIRLFAVRATVANQPQKASPVVNLDQQSQ